MSYELTMELTQLYDVGFLHRVARPNTLFSRSRTLQIHFPKYFLFQPLDGARSHAFVARGPARAGLSRYEFCRSWRQAAALATIDRSRSQPAEKRAGVIGLSRNREDAGSDAGSF